MPSDPREKEDGSPLPANLSQWLSVLLNRAAQETRDLFNSYLQPLHLTSKGFAVLSTLQEQPASSQIDLAHLLTIDRTTMVAVIDDLERHHFVTRTRHPHDRRLYLITLTPAGQQVYQQAQHNAKRSEEEYFAFFTQEQREQLRMLLQQLLPTKRDHSL